MDSVGCDFEVFEADVDAPESGLMLVEPEKARSLPPLSLALFPVLFTFALRLEMEVGVVAYNSISLQNHQPLILEKQKYQNRWKTYAGKTDCPNSKFQHPLFHSEHTLEYLPTSTARPRPRTHTGFPH